MLWLPQMAGWIACVAYATIPLFWLMIHSRADYWRKRASSPYLVLVPRWMGMWVGLGLLTATWRRVSLYTNAWTWIPAALLFAMGIWIYRQSRVHFSWEQLSGLPELTRVNSEQRLVTSGIRARVRHPVYVGHLCQMLAWSVGTGLVVCWVLTGFAMLTGAVMIRMEDAELRKRFGEEYERYQSAVPAILPRIY